MADKDKGKGDAEHTKGKRPSTENKHQKGAARKAADQKRSNNPNKRRESEIEMEW